ncbi:hypothetical protein KKG16_00305 [Patescibacteria group bacterium]|nr:hypothetical protein [Patescibacteria group bacterium]
MADEITNKVLLEHMQSMKHELQQQITGFGMRMERVEVNLKQLSQHVEDGFEEARQHRQALQEDLEATISMQAKHQQKLAKISV